ncbi:MAG: glycosyltransferase family 2 protein [bacterium]
MNGAVIIVNYNGGGDLVRDLAIVLRLATAENLEVVVVDNASTDGSVEEIRRVLPAVRVVPLSTNRGFAYGVNRGIEASDGPVVIVLNPDAVPEPSALGRLRAAVLGNPDCGILGGAVTDASGNLDVCCARPLPELSDILREGVFLPKRTDSSWLRLREGDGDGLIPTGAISGAAMAILRDNLARIGPMNEEFFLYNEDIEWCDRAQRVGLRTAVVPAARFVHRQGASTRKDERIPFAARMLADFLYFVDLRGESPSAVRWRWVLRQSFRACLYAVFAIVGTRSRRASSRRRAAIYLRLAWLAVRTPWPPNHDAPRADPRALRGAI